MSDTEERNHLLVKIDREHPDSMFDVVVLDMDMKSLLETCLYFEKQGRVQYISDVFKYLLTKFKSIQLTQPVIESDDNIQVVFFTDYLSCFKFVNRHITEENGVFHIEPGISLRNALTFVLSSFIYIDCDVWLQKLRIYSMKRESGSKFSIVHSRVQRENEFTADYLRFTDDENKVISNTVLKVISGISLLCLFKSFSGRKNDPHVEGFIKERRDRICNSLKRVDPKIEGLERLCSLISNQIACFPKLVNIIYEFLTESNGTLAGHLRELLAGTGMITLQMTYDFINRRPLTEAHVDRLVMKELKEVKRIWEEEIETRPNRNYVYFHSSDVLKSIPLIKYPNAAYCAVKVVAMDGVFANYIPNEFRYYNKFDFLLEKELNQPKEEDPFLKQDIDFLYKNPPVPQHKFDKSNVTPLDFLSSLKDIIKIMEMQKSYVA